MPASETRPILDLAKEISEAHQAWIERGCRQKGVAAEAERIGAMQERLEKMVMDALPPMALRELFVAVKSAWEGCNEHDYWSEPNEEL